MTPSPALSVETEAANSNAPKLFNEQALRRLVADVSRLSAALSPAYSNEDDFEAMEPQEAMILQHRTKARKLGLSILRKWHARIHLDELYSIVDLSLCEAARLYNPNKGASFLTFLFYHLRGNLIRAVSDAVNSTSVPYALLESADGHLDGDGKVGTAIDIAEALCNHESPLPDETLLKKEIRGITRDACGKLHNLEREIVERMYLTGEQVMDIAHDLGYSRCHVSRIKKSALKSLHKNLSRELRDTVYASGTPEEGPAPERRSSTRGRTLAAKVSKTKTVHRKKVAQN